jgi:diguanylate cyclase (GGDEF)-like protein
LAPSQPFESFASGSGDSLTERDLLAIRELAQAMRHNSWDIAIRCVAVAIEQDILPALANIPTVKQVANLPAFIGGLATALVRPRPRSDRLGTNPILTRLARDHVIERERLGFTTREIVQEFLLLRRVIWRFVQERAQHFEASAVLRLEDALNSIIDEVIVECTVTYFERATHALSEQSRSDSLTGLLNHQAIHSRLDRELDRSRRYGHELQVIYFDLDNFKEINDTFGHPSGDKVLIDIADIIRESIRETDFAGRIGGDEFVIGLVESTELAAALLLDRLRAHLARRIAEGTVPGEPGISAGAAGFPKEADTAQDLLVLADRRLYEDKRMRKSTPTEVE